MKVLNAPFYVTNIPYICHQPASGPDQGLVYKLRLISTPQAATTGGVQMSLSILTEGVTMLPSGGLDIETAVLLYLLADGEPNGKVSSHIAVDINKVANEIAAETRRGSGNHIICHASELAKVEGSYGSFKPPTMSFHGRDLDQLKGKIIVTYRGSNETDGGPILVTNPDFSKYAIASQKDTKAYVKILEL